MPSRDAGASGEVEPENVPMKVAGSGEARLTTTRERCGGTVQAGRARCEAEAHGDVAGRR